MGVTFAVFHELGINYVIIILRTAYRNELKPLEKVAKEEANEQRNSEEVFQTLINELHTLCAHIYRVCDSYWYCGCVPRVYI